MRMRVTVGSCAVIGTFAGIYALDQLRIDTCLALSFHECLNLSSFSGILLHLLPFMALGFMAGVLLTPVFLTEADEQAHKLKWKLRELRKLQLKQRNADVDAQIAAIQQQVNP